MVAMAEADVSSLRLVRRRRSTRVSIRGITSKTGTPTAAERSSGEVIEIPRSSVPTARRIPKNQPPDCSRAIDKRPVRPRRPFRDLSRIQNFELLALLPDLQLGCRFRRKLLGQELTIVSLGHFVVPHQLRDFLLSNGNRAQLCLIRRNLLG